jgi:hypothetical protein
MSLKCLGSLKAKAFNIHRIEPIFISVTFNLEKNQSNYH